MSGPNHFETMRAALVPQGDAPIVRLGGESMYFEASFVQKCIDEAERACRLAGPMGLGQPTPLERLAMHLLCKSAGIEFKS